MLPRTKSVPSPEISHQTIPRHETLNKRDIPVLKQIALGLTNLEIAAKLELSHNTIIKRIKNITKKTGIHSRVLLGFYALGWGIVTEKEIKEAMALDKSREY